MQLDIGPDVNPPASAMAPQLQNVLPDSKYRQYLLSNCNFHPFPRPHLGRTHFRFNYPVALYYRP